MLWCSISVIIFSHCCCGDYSSSYCWHIFILNTVLRLSSLLGNHWVHYSSPLCLNSVQFLQEGFRPFPVYLAKQLLTYAISFFSPSRQTAFSITFPKALIYPNVPNILMGFGPSQFFFPPVNSKSLAYTNFFLIRPCWSGTRWVLLTEDLNKKRHLSPLCFLPLWLHSHIITYHI